MASTLSIIDLRKMQVSDLEKDLQEKKLAVAKTRLDIGMMSQKDTAIYKKEKKDIARMLTVINEKKGEGMTLKTEEKTATVRAPRASKKAKGSSTSSK
jgi:ribosomal protein L29